MYVCVYLDYYKNAFQGLLKSAILNFTLKYVKLDLR